MSQFTLSNIPAPLEWQIEPLEWQLQPPSGLAIKAGAKTDWFIDPNGSFQIGNAPNALFTPPDTDFLLSAKVSVEFAATFDAGVLRIHEQEDVWAKLCFEYSPQALPTVVSVVTRKTSDDCNSVSIAGRSVYLRVARIGKTFAFHYSPDGSVWHLVRYFTLGTLTNLKVGFSSQSPTGQGCSATFADIRYQAVTLSDLRNGS